MISFPHKIINIINRDKLAGVIYLDYPLSAFKERV